MVLSSAQAGTGRRLRVEAIADPDPGEHEFLAWVAGSFDDPETCERFDFNARLTSVRWAR